MQKLCIFAHLHYQDKHAEEAKIREQLQHLKKADASPPPPPPPRPSSAPAPPPKVKCEVKKEEPAGVDFESEVAKVPVVARAPPAKKRELEVIELSDSSSGDDGDGKRKMVGGVSEPARKKQHSSSSDLRAFRKYKHV